MHRPKKCALVLATALACPAAAQGRLPPSWQTDDPGFYGSQSREEAPRRRARKAAPRPWWKPRAAVGAGLSLPELTPVEGWLFFGRYVALRGFVVPPIPFNIRIEMPADLVSTPKKLFGVAHPEYTIRFKATYGPQYGVEALAFPFGGSFFVGGGVSSRTMRLVGNAESQILLCSLPEAAKEPPCGDEASSLRPDTKLRLDADVTTTALLSRASVGWFWHVGAFSYVSLAFGATRPMRVDRKVGVVATVTSPSQSEDQYDGALGEVKREKESELREKAIKEMRPVDERLLPLVGLSAGVRF